MTRRQIGLGVCVVMVMAWSGLLVAREEPADPTSYQTTVDFSLAQQIELDGELGQVQFRSVEFVEKSAKNGGIKGAFSSSKDDLESEITTRLNCATTSTDKWKLNVTVEFLDDEGEVIDRSTTGISVKNEAKIFDFKHTTLKWVVPRIKQARITVGIKG